MGGIPWARQFTFFVSFTFPAKPFRQMLPLPYNRENQDSATLKHVIRLGSLAPLVPRFPNYKMRIKNVTYIIAVMLIKDLEYR